MTGLVDWATERARMIAAFIVLSILAGSISYISIPKEGEPDIDIPMVFVSTVFQGISASDSERLLVKPLEQELREIEGLDDMTGFAAENYAGVLLKFEFGWDKAATLAEVREKVDKAEGEFPSGFEDTSINEFNFSQFPILVISLSGDAPERTLLRVAKDLQRDVESLPEVLEAGLAGHREEMLEVLIDPLKLEAYDITAAELLSVVVNNNQLVAGGAIEAGSGQFSVKVPGAFEDTRDVYSLPIKVNGDRVVTMGDVASINLTFEDRVGTARYNGEQTVALQIVKRKGQPVIDTVETVKAQVAESMEEWPQSPRDAITVSYSMDESNRVNGMVSQLEGSVLTAIALVMIVVLAALGVRSALLVGFAIPTSFLLCFALLSVFGMSITNIVMFGLILAVGMLVDGAIVVVEYADKEIQRGVGPMRAYGGAAKRMFWPIVSSTATTLCAFLPMLFWPGIPGEFMGNLPVTLIFVLSASLVVALVYLPVVGGIAGRISRANNEISDKLRATQTMTARLIRVAVLAAALVVVILGMGMPGDDATAARIALIALAVLVAYHLIAAVGSLMKKKDPGPKQAGYRRTPFGRVVKFIVGNPIMPFVAIALTVFAVFSAFSIYGENNNGVEFFTETEPERAVAFVRARGNLSLDERDRLLREIENLIIPIDGVESVFSFAGEGGLNQRGGEAPNDAIGQIQIELEFWRDRGPGVDILAEINEAVSAYPGVIAEVIQQQTGPEQGKPIQLRIESNDWELLQSTAGELRDAFEADPDLREVEDTRPLPGIDWRIDVDVAQAGRFGADVSQIGTMVQLVTRGVLLDTMRPQEADDEIEIRVRFPKADRILATLETLRIRTQYGLVPLSNFITITPEPKLGEITRYDGVRFFMVKADVAPGVNVNAKVAELTEWLTGNDVVPETMDWAFVGDQEEQNESQAFLAQAFVGALGLMFVILLAQFNSIYNSILVLTAVVMSVAGVLMGMLIMGQTFSIIMTGTGIVALAGIVVNNNIVLIDTYREFERQMPRIEAIIRTAEQRIRPVLLTTITTMAGLTPMMFAISIDFFNGGYDTGAPAARWWTQLATAVVFGLGTATVLTLIFTPAMLAARVWLTKGVRAAVQKIRARNQPELLEEQAVAQAARNAKPPVLDWSKERPGPITDAPMPTPDVKAAE